MTDRQEGGGGALKMNFTSIIIDYLWRPVL